MKKIEYSCDICDEVKDRLKILGIYFTGHVATGHTFVFRAPENCETHICGSCEKIIAELHGARKVEGPSCGE